MPFKSRGEKISNTIKMQRSLSFFVGLRHSEFFYDDFQLFLLWILIGKENIETSNILF